MNVNTLTQGEPWMTAQERDINHHLIGALAQFLADAGVPETALIALRVNDLAATWLLARRLESALTPAEGEAPPCPTPAQANAIGKCRDRLRRALKDLEDLCKKTGAPDRQGLGLIERMHEAVRLVRATDLADKTNDRNNKNQCTECPAKGTASNPDTTENSPAGPDDQSKQHTRQNHTTETSQTAPKTAGKPTAQPGPQPSQVTPQKPENRTFLTWTARAKAPPSQCFRA